MNFNLVTKIILLLMFLLTPVILKAEKVTVMTEDLPPYQFLDKDKKITGIATARLKNTLACAKVDAEIFVVPWSQAYNYVLTHKNSIIYSMVRDESRETKFYWIGKVANTGINAYKLKSRKDIDIHSIEEMKNYRIGVMEDDFVVKILTDKGLKVGQHLFYYLDSKNKVKLLAYNRYDLIDENPEVVKHKIKAKVWGYDQLEAVFTILDNKPLYMAMNHNSDKDLVNRMKSCSEKLPAIE